MADNELSLLDVDAIHAAQLAEWTDGVRVMKNEGGMVTQDSASYVHVSDQHAGHPRILEQAMKPRRLALNIVGGLVHLLRIHFR